eukprot:CAMPEP_0202906596 /NCGR_PEP_ID=MMETSP1392-20130828/39682_1 /ASSEMBLY_ACC=CAM_ASM_000868 /TAXON_ID=225041 /ORGANISM="Chlamydomonas chlamydogama, Strain SAG 11-48b" /LENGTH=141 /DNA_ID=CAMNT_0049595197 /DNA_START=153 /DNA_END=574 /DNA_ORIENTATION=-
MTPLLLGMSLVGGAMQLCFTLVPMCHAVVMLMVFCPMVISDEVWRSWPTLPRSCRLTPKQLLLQLSNVVFRFKASLQDACCLKTMLQFLIFAFLSKVQLTLLLKYFLLIICASLRLSELLQAQPFPNSFAKMFFRTVLPVR